MKTIFKLLGQRVIGLALVLGSIAIMPYADGDITYSLITIPLGLVMIVGKLNMFDDDLEEEDDNIEEEEF